MWRFIFALACLFLLTGCVDDSDRLESDVSHFIVEGWIEDGGFPVVILSRSLPLSTDYQDIDSLSDYLVRWAKVTISDGTDSVVLTGKYDKGYFPPYIYTTSRIRGKAGKTYYLTAEYRDLRATAQTTVPAIPDNCSFRVERCAGSDTLFQIRAHFKDNPDEKNYYQFFTRVGTDTKQYQASYLGSIDDGVLKGETDMTVYRGHQLSDKDYTPYFLADDTVSVKFAQVDETSFRIWDSYTKIQSLSSNMFFSTSSDIESNITGGYGYWCGYGTITDYIVVRDSIGH
jgi:hypothetical protein